MFTGIVTDIGEVIELEKRGDLRARIATSYPVDGIDIGASIACNGVCLTVIATGPGSVAGSAAGSAAGSGAGTSSAAKGWFDVEISAESVGKTNIGGWAMGKHLNLERALKVGDELGGHIVSGHVDGVAEIVGMRNEGDSTRFTFRAPHALAGFIAPKGSVALNGTSLTVNEVNGADFGVNIIPHTKTVTTWGQAAEGDLVNIEIDTLARYVSRLRDWGGA